MIITRWHAPVIPTKEQFISILEKEDLEPSVENFSKEMKISEHRHPFAEVRYIVSGEMILSVSGNQFVLRAGDKIEIPANTKHSYTTQSEGGCISICAQRVF